MQIHLDYAHVDFVRSNTTENTTHHNYWELPNRPERTTIPYEQRATTTIPTHQNKYQSTLNQQVPSSSPGRRTKIVRLYGLMHPNGRAHWATV